MPRSSRLAQCSTIWPSSSRNQWDWVVAKVLPVGGKTVSTSAVRGVDRPGRDVASVHRRVDRDQVAVGQRVVDVVVQVGERCPQPLRGRVEAAGAGTRDDGGWIRFSRSTARGW